MSDILASWHQRQCRCLPLNTGYHYGDGLESIGLEKAGQSVNILHVRQEFDSNVPSLLLCQTVHSRIHCSRLDAALLCTS